MPTFPPQRLLHKRDRESAAVSRGGCGHSDSASGPQRPHGSTREAVPKRCQLQRASGLPSRGQDRWEEGSEQAGQVTEGCQVQEGCLEEQEGLNSSRRDAQESFEQDWREAGGRAVTVGRGL